MPQWVDQFENHNLHQQLQVLRDTLAQLGSSEEPSPDLTEALERLKQINEQIAKILGSLDPFLTPISILNNLDSNVQQIKAYCDQYISDKNPTHLTNANDQADGALIQLAALEAYKL